MRSFTIPTLLSALLLLLLGTMALADPPSSPPDLILVNDRGEVVEGNSYVNTAAFVIHGQVHAARPDVIAAAHAHSVQAVRLRPGGSRYAATPVLASVATPAAISGTSRAGGIEEVEDTYVGISPASGAG